MAPCGSLHPPSLTVPSPSIFSDLVRHSSVWNSICSRVPSAPARFPSDHPRIIRWLRHPFPTSRPSLACILLSSQACGEGRRPRFRPCCPHVLSRPPLPPCVVGQPSLFLFPIATEAAQAPAAPCPRPAPALHSHFLSPGAGAGALEARPGPATPAPGVRPSSPVPASGLCHHWPGRPGFHLPPRPPSICSASRLTGRHAPAVGHLPPRPGLGATHPGHLGSPGRIPAPAGEGGAHAGRWGRAWLGERGYGPSSLMSLCSSQLTPE